MKTLYDRIQDKEFDAKSDYPARVSKPALLCKKVSELTDEELLTIPRLRQEYEQAEQERRTARDKHLQEQRELDDQFYQAALEECGMDPNLPITGMLWSLAWDRGHSSGRNEVLLCLDNLSGIYREAIRMAGGRTVGK